MIIFRLNTLYVNFNRIFVMHVLKLLMISTLHSIDMTKQYVLLSFKAREGGHGGAVVTLSPPTSEVDCSNPLPYVRMLVVAN